MRDKCQTFGRFHRSRPLASSLRRRRRRTPRRCSAKCPRSSLSTAVRD